MAQQNLLRKTLLSSSDFSKGVRTNKNPLNPGKDGSERLATTRSSGSDHRNPFEGDVISSSSSSETRAGLGGVSYFPDHVARVSYIASVVKPDVNGHYLKDLHDGMELLATRLAPFYFPGTIVRHITTQVDGYFSAACPSKNFNNCQDVTASIGIYLSAVPIIEGSASSNNSLYNSLGKNKAATTIVDPSTMTEELIAFQESLNTAIANNELQEAIRQEYRQNPGDDVSPAVVIVTDTINNVGFGVNVGSNSDNDDSSLIIDGLIAGDSNSIGNNDKNDFFDNTADDISSSATIDIPLGEPTIPTSSMVATGKTDISRKVVLATGGVMSLLLMSLMLAAFMSVVRRRRRHDDGRRGDATIVKGKENIIKYHSSGHSKINNLEESYDYDESGQKLLESIYIADSASDGGDIEEGFTGRTLRTIASELTHTNSSHEMLVRLVATSSSSYSHGNHVDVETNDGSSNNNSNRNICQYDILSPTKNAYGERNIADDLIAKTVVSTDVLTSFNNDDRSHSNVTRIEASAKSYDDKYDEDDEDNDFVLGEDDVSEGSVGQHLMSASKRSESCLVPSLRNLSNQDLVLNTSPQTTRTSPTRADDNSLHETVKEPINSNSTFSSGSGNISSSLEKASMVSSSQSSLTVASSTHSDRNIESMADISRISELDVAIANCDWATVGATAAVLASSSSSANQPPISRGIKIQDFSSSEFSQKADELDKMIEAGDWQAVIVTAAKFDAEGITCEEDASRSCRSRTSTQGSDANDSYTSIMDNSSDGRSASITRSITTSASQKERLQEIRAQVTQMVQEVVPDEQDNVDEMMIQFKGREEDLLETLRTMKERNVVRKARVESHKIARRNIRPRDKTEGGSPNITQSSNRNEITTHESLDAEQQQELDTYIHNENNDSSSITTDGAEEQNTNQDFSTMEKVGSFENSTIVDPDEAASAAAAWAIQRSLDEMMVKEGEKVSAKR